MYRVVPFSLIFLSAAFAAEPQPAEVGNQEALRVLAAVLRDRGESGWDMETRCRFLKGGGFSREEARFLIEAVALYSKELDESASLKRKIPAGPGHPIQPNVLAEARSLDDKSGKILDSMLKDLHQLRGGALKPKLEAQLFLMKSKIRVLPSGCQSRMGRLLAYTAMSETAEGKITSLALTVSDAWEGHRVRTKTVLRGPREGIDIMQGEWGSESAAVARLDGAQLGLFLSESEHHETCAGSNLVKLAGATKGTKYREAPAVASLQ